MHTNQPTRACVSILAALASSALLSQEPESRVVTKTEIVKKAVDHNSFPDVIHPQKFSEIIPKVFSLKSTPLSIVLRVGQELSISSLRIQAQDKDQIILGTLTAYNTQLKPGAYRISGPLKIAGITPGTGEIIITPPLGKALITDRPIPELHIVVTVLE